MVAPTNSTVLILGESGTGKELIARAIHKHSQRKEQAFIKVNCAALAEGILESELFGHERGAFTDAVRQKPGRFELADEGYQFRAYRGSIDPRVLQLEFGERMEGIRQTVSMWYESMLSGKVLMDWKYQFELDIATEGLQRQTGFPRWEEQTGEFEGEYEDFDGEEDVDFNFMNHRVAVMLAWRLFSRSTVALYARHDAKFYSNWLVQATNGQRHDNLNILHFYIKQKLFPGLSARLRFSLEKNNSNDPTQEYIDRIYSVGLQFTF
jgi:hypothetical protein